MIKVPIRVHGSTGQILSDILKLVPIDTYRSFPLRVMDRVQGDKTIGLEVPAYKLLSEAAVSIVLSIWKDSNSMRKRKKHLLSYKLMIERSMPIAFYTKGCFKFK